MAMTPEEKAEYRAKVQKSFYVEQLVVEEPVVVTTAAVPVEEPVITLTDENPKTK